MPSETPSEESEPEFEPQKIEELTPEEWKLYSHFRSLVKKDMDEDPSKAFDNLATYWVTKNHKLTWLEKDTMIFSEYEIREGAIWLVRKGSMTDDMFNVNIDFYDKLWDIAKTMREIAKSG